MPGRSSPREQLLSEVWGIDFDPGTNVVEVCVRRLRRKLGPAAPIETVRHAGYRIRGRLTCQSGAPRLTSSCVGPTAPAAFGGLPRPLDWAFRDRRLHGRGRVSDPEADVPVRDRWGDSAPYVLAKDGSFEKKSPWRGTATTMQENDPFLLAGPGQQSMRLRGDQTLTSPVLCVNDKLPHLRFVARALDPTSQLVVEVLWKERGEDKELVLDEHAGGPVPALGPVQTSCRSPPR